MIAFGTDAGLQDGGLEISAAEGELWTNAYVGTGP